MKKADDIELKFLDADALRDEARNKLNAAEDAETPDAADVERLTAEYRAADVARAAVRTEYRESIEAKVETGAPVVEDAETRERIELRGKATIGGFLLARMQGRMPAGELAEYASACGVSDGIPIDIFEKDRPAPIEHRADAATVAPATGTGATLAPIQPFIFSKSIAPLLGIDMPTVGSGAYSEATISTALSAAAKAKGAAEESTAAVLTPQTATARRLSGRLSLNVESIATIGQDNFEGAVGDNLVMTMSDQYDRQCITGDGVAPNVNGLVNQLTDPADPGAVATFALFLKAAADQVDALWATELSEVAMITNADVYRLSAQVFRANNADLSFSDYARQALGGWSCNARMPATTAGKIARAIVYRMGMAGIRTASHPVWATLTIDDIYSDSASGIRHVTMHLLVGSQVIVVQPDAYALAEFKLA